MGVLQHMKPNPVTPTLAYNTGTLYDYLSGRAVMGIDGKWYIDGGIPACLSGFHSLPNNYKSTSCGTFIARCVAWYTESDAVIFDSESSLTNDMDRLVRFSGAPESEHAKIKEVISVYKGPELNATLVDVTMDKICKIKQEHEKDCMMTLPIMDPATGKAARTWIPSFGLLDSISYLKTTLSAEVLSIGLDDSRVNTVYMVEGGQKSILIRKMHDMCQSFGIPMVVTAHLDDTINMDPRNPLRKELQHMKQGQKMKYVGAAFDRLTNNLVQILGAQILKDSNGEALYGMPNTPYGDVNEVSMLTQRCKTNASGNTFPFVVSQFDGLLPDLTNYHFLRSNGYFGLNGNNQKHQSFLLPDVTITRNTFRELASASYELRRAIELTAQWLFVKTFWNTRNFPMDMSMDPKVLMDMLMANKSIKVNDILNTEGRWSYSKKKGREYMSIFDVIELIQKK